MRRNEYARTQRADAPVLTALLDLDIENSTLMTATRNAGSLVLATCQDPCPLLLRQSIRVPLSLRVCLCSCYSSYTARVLSISYAQHALSRRSTWNSWILD